MSVLINYENDLTIEDEAEELKFIPIRANKKPLPSMKGWETKTKEQLFTKEQCYSFEGCGALGLSLGAYDLLCIDIDVPTKEKPDKTNGYRFYKKYFSQFDFKDTVKYKTASGGGHILLKINTEEMRNFFNHGKFNLDKFGLDILFYNAYIKLHTELTSLDGIKHIDEYPGLKEALKKAVDDHPIHVKELKEKEKELRVKEKLIDDIFKKYDFLNPIEEPGRHKNMISFMGYVNKEVIRMKKDFNYSKEILHLLNHNYVVPSLENEDLKAMENQSEKHFNEDLAKYKPEKQTKTIIAVPEFDDNGKTNYLMPDKNGNLKVNPGLLVQRIKEDHNILYNCKIGFFKYENGVYKPMDDESIKQIISSYVKASLRKNSLMQDVLAQTKTEFNIQGLEKSLDTDENILNLKDTLIKINKNNGELKKIDHTKDLLSSIQLDFESKTNNDGKVFLKYLDEVTRGDEDKKKLLQEILGYCVSSYNCAKKAFLIQGAKDTGKSVFLQLINILVPQDFRSAIPFQDLGDRFNTAQLYRKVVNLQADISAAPIKNVSLFKSLTGGDLVSGEFKGLDRFSFINRSKFIFSCNELPANYEDRTGAFYERMILLKFDRVFKKHEQDKDLLTETGGKLRLEKDFIGNWALEGLQRLIRNNFEFTETKEQTEMIKEWKMKNSNVLEFIEECCELRHDYGIPVKILFFKYEGWCSENGYRAVTKKTLKNEILNNFMNVKYDDNANIEYDGYRSRGFKGITIVK